MSERRSTVSVSPETDDFAARYDRMIRKGSGSWVIKALLGIVALVVVVSVVARLLA